MHPHLVTGWWKDTGKIEDMLEANRIILDTFSARGLEAVDGESKVEGKVVDRARARSSTRCTVRGPAVIGAGAEIRDAFVGPYTAIGAGCLIDRCEIENSIVLEGSRLERIPVRIADSLIGKNVRIHPGARAAARPPVPHRRQLRDRHRMRLLVTGGCGFIGSHFIRHVFESRGDAVSIVNLDKLTYAANPANLADVVSRPGSSYRFVRGDIADPDVVGVAMEGCDAVVNFAAETHVDRSLLGDASFIETDVRGVFVLLEEAKRRGVSEVHPDLDRRGLRHDPRRAPSPKTRP